MNLKGFKRYPLKDYPGYDIAKFENSDIKKCARECNNQEGCAGFAFIFTARLCYIKHTVKASGRNFRVLYSHDLFIRIGGPSGKLLKNSVF